jgi:hypothetical protein
MDPSRFDTLARSLTTASSRRIALLALVTGLVAPFAPDLDAGATRRKRRNMGGNPRRSAQHESTNRLGMEKKKGKKKKKKKKTTLTPTSPAPPTCTPNCSGGRNCGANGCGGVCGACSGTETCGGGGMPGVCGSSSACTPACTGGRDCQSNGTCTCPPEKPHAAPEQYCDDTCRECCIDSNCHVTKHCSHPQGSICVCTGHNHHDCGDGICRQCCSEDDCYAYHNWSGSHVICTAEGNSAGTGLCRCDAGFMMCGATPKHCVDASSNSEHCGICYNVCWNGTTCIKGECK